MTKPVLPAIASRGAAKTMSSREIAELTGKLHQHVRRDIEKMMSELAIDASRFGRIYLDSMNREQTEYLLDQDLTMTLVMGYSAPLRYKVAQRWRELEEGKAAPAAIKDRRVTLITSALASGLIDRAEAEKRIAALLDGVAPLKPAATTAAPKSQKAKTKPWRKAKPSGAMTWNLAGNTGFRLYELGHWVEGGNAEMFRALRDGGFMDGNNRFTAKGERLSCGVRNGYQMVYAEKLLRAIGAW